MNTRNNGSMVYVPIIKNEVARASFYYQGATLFNSLPKEIRTKNNHVKFKRLLKETKV